MILLLCTGNSAQSQLAEALVNHLRGDAWHALSAGTRPTGQVHPHAVTAMREIGIDIAGTRSMPADEFRSAPLDLVVTVCDDAAEECPVGLGQGKRVHISFPDPAGGTLNDFRMVRDSIGSKSNLTWMHLEQQPFTQNRPDSNQILTSRA